MEDNTCLVSTIFLNGRREGANPSLRVIVPPSLESHVLFCGLVLLFRIRVLGP